MTWADKTDGEIKAACARLMGWVWNANNETPGVVLYTWRTEDGEHARTPSCWNPTTDRNDAAEVFNSEVVLKHAAQEEASYGFESMGGDMTQRDRCWLDCLADPRAGICALLDAVMPLERRGEE